MPETKPDRIHPFVERLLQLSDPDNPDRAALAHLRRGLGADDPSYALGRCGWLFRMFADDLHAERAALLTAGVFAHAKGKCPQKKGTTLGHALGQLPGAGDVPSIEKRFIDLLDTNETDLPYKLRQAISLLGANSISLDWHQLFFDLRHWNDPRKRVQKSWARGFWSRANADTPELQPSHE